MKWEDLTTYDRALSLLRSGEMKSYTPKFSSSVSQAMMGARRFEIKPNAAQLIKQAITAYPEFIAANSQFAIPPFENMWIEFEAPSLLHDPLLSPVMEEGSDKRIGYLIRNNVVTVFFETNTLMPMPTVIAYELNTPMPMDHQLRFANWFGVSRIGLDQFLWGHNMAQYLEEGVKRSLREQHSIRLVPGAENIFRDEDEDVIPKLIRDSYYGSAGELRNILGILLMLNQPANTRIINEVPRKRGLIRGKPAPYFGYSTVDIRLDKRDVSSILSRPRVGEHASPRWHEVRGHFCHNKEAKAAKHTHEWEQVEEKRWECKKGCGGKRWWRELPNGRGSAGIGFVHQKRMIRTKEDIRAPAPT